MKNIISDTIDLFGKNKAQFTTSLREYNRAEKPSYLKNESDFDVIYRDQELLFSQGRLAMACILQANAGIFREGGDDLPGVVIYTEDSSIIGDPEALMNIADELTEEDPRCGESPELNAIIDAMEDQDRVLFNLPVPAGLTGGKAVYYTTVMLHRKHLPFGYLHAPWLPLLVCPESTAAAMVLPEKYWSAGLLKAWEEAGELPELDEEAVKKIEELRSQGDRALADKNFLKAARSYDGILDMMGDPAVNWSISYETLKNLGEALFFLGEFHDAAEVLLEASENPDIEEDYALNRRLGAAFFELGDRKNAYAEFLPAFEGQGEDFFSGEDPKYLAFLKEAMNDPQYTSSDCGCGDDCCGHAK